MSGDRVGEDPHELDSGLLCLRRRQAVEFLQDDRIQVILRDFALKEVQHGDIQRPGKVRQINRRKSALSKFVF